VVLGDSFGGRFEACDGCVVKPHAVATIIRLPTACQSSLDCQELVPYSGFLCVVSCTVDLQVSLWEKLEWSMVVGQVCRHTAAWWGMAGR